MFAYFMKHTAVLLWLIFFVVLVSLLVLQYWWPRRRLRELASKIPGPKSLPLVGHALMFCMDNEKFFQKLCKTLNEYTPICRLWLGPLLFVFLSEPKDLEIILGNPKLVYKSKLYKVLVELYGDGLIMNGGEKWKRHRKIITPTFHFKILEQFVDIFNANSWIFVNKLRTLAGDGSAAISLFPHMALCTLDMICQTAMGINIEAQQNCESELVKAVGIELQMGHERFLKPWLWNYTIFRWTKHGRDHVAAEKIVRGFTNNIIARKIKEHKEREKQQEMCETGQQLKSDGNDELGRTNRLAFLDLMIEQRGSELHSLRDKDMRDEAFTLIVAGHETTANSNCFILTLIGLHDHVQDEIARELDLIFADNPDRHASYHDLQNMTYLEMVIKESLRLYPAAPLIARHLMEDININGYELPAGCSLAFNLHKTHRNPVWFPDPERFDPERFRPGSESTIKPHPFSYVPFGAGPRNCVGKKYAILQMKTVISTVLRNFTVRSVTTREELDDLKIDIIIRPINGFKLKFIPRR